MRIAISLVVVLCCLGLTKGNCQQGYHECYNYSADCIPNYKVCDGKEDCYYGDDEENCIGPTMEPAESTTRGNSCPEGQYECLTGLCIPNAWTCDGTKDCPTYGDDEEHCSKNVYIPDNEVVYNSTASNTMTTSTWECENSFDYIYDRCVLVDPFTATSWDEARYLCEMFNSDLVVLDDYNFYAELLQYIENKGLDSHSYWVGATDKMAAGVWLWVDFSPVSSGAPLWALSGCTGDYQLEPGLSDNYNGDCGFLDKDRGLHMGDASCDESFASICQTTSSKKEKKDQKAIQNKNILMTQNENQ